jgi:hypothetical protein
MLLYTASEMGPLHVTGQDGGLRWRADAYYEITGEWIFLTYNDTLICISGALLSRVVKIKPV